MPAPHRTQVLAEMTLQVRHANGLHDLKMAGHRRNLKGLSGQRGPPFALRAPHTNLLTHTHSHTRAAIRGPAFLGGRIESGQRADARLAAARISS